MRLPIVGLMALAMLGGCGAKPSAAVDGAWVRLPAVAGRPGAAYFTLKAGATPLTLLSLKTPAAVRTELHESMAGHSGMMTMTPLPQVDVPADGTVAFAPGGKHAMLFDIDPALKAGGTTRVTLAFADGTTIEAPATIRGAGDAAP